MESKQKDIIEQIEESGNIGEHHVLWHSRLKIFILATILGPRNLRLDFSGPIFTDPENLLYICEL